MSYPTQCPLCGERPKGETPFCFYIEAENLELTTCIGDLKGGKFCNWDHLKIWLRRIERESKSRDAGK